MSLLETVREASQDVPVERNSFDNEGNLWAFNGFCSSMVICGDIIRHHALDTHTPTAPSQSAAISRVLSIFFWSLLENKIFYVLSG